MSKDGLRVGVAGATGALGKEIISVLEASPWRPGTIVPLASAKSTVPFVDWQGSQVAVDELGHEDLGSLDAVFVALPRAIARDFVERAAVAGVRVVDASGSHLDDLNFPLVLPWMGLDKLGAPRARDVAAIPSAAATLVGTVVGAIARGFDVGSVTATVMTPASAAGRDAIEELSRQVVSLFNGSPPPRKVYPQGLAFDLLPLVGEAGVTGWSTEEIRIAAEIGRLTSVRADVTLVAAPLFSGMAATIRVEIDEDVLVEDVIDKLEEGLVKVTLGSDPRKLPRPRKLEGERQVHVARVRRTLDGKAIELWASMDNLRVAAVAAVGTMAALLDRQES